MTITVERITYRIAASETVGELRARGFHAAAGILSRNNAVANHIVTRPKGSRQHLVREHADGTFSYVTVLR